MATKTIPEQTVEVCDTCGRDGFLETCITCGDKYCVIHNSIISGCYVSVDCCSECGNREDVREIVSKHAIDLKKIKFKRDEELSKLNTNNS